MRSRVAANYSLRTLLREFFNARLNALLHALLHALLRARLHTFLNALLHALADAFFRWQHRTWAQRLEQTLFTSRLSRITNPATMQD